MGKIIKTVKFSELKNGMIIAKDVEQNGSIIIKKGLVLSDAIIEKLNGAYIIDTIDVYEKSNEEISEENKKIIEFNKIENEFNKIADSLKRTFDRNFIDDSGFLSDIRNFSNKIQEKIKDQDLVIKNIVLHGSGEDVIYRHGVNVSALCALLGSWLKMEDKEIRLLIYSAMLHDCGKTKIDSKILNKPGKLTDDEYKKVKKHSVFGYEMVKKLQYIDKKVSYGVLMHHERLDGSGYPLGLKGEEIHYFAKIIAIADVFDAINSNRGYKSKRAPFEALKIVKEESLGKLDYKYVEVFLEHIMSYYLGEEVVLNTGERCKILQMNINNIQRPLVLKDGQFIDLAKNKELYIEEMLL